MCVIIKREPKIIIPDEKLISACHVNSDGWGYSVVDRGKLETKKFHDPKGTKPEDVIKALKDAEDNLLFLHLRFTTAGKTNTDNCHPFEVFKGDNYEVQFMHNGTLNKFSKGTTDDYSDTYHFTQEILKPLVRAFYEVDGASVLANPTLKAILDEFQAASAFALYDNEGVSNLFTLASSGGRRCCVTGRCVGGGSLGSGCRCCWGGGRVGTGVAGVLVIVPERGGS